MKTLDVNGFAMPHLNAVATLPCEMQKL